MLTKSQIDFVSIATPLVNRGFRVTPVHPETKMGVMKNWQKFQLTTIEDVRKYAKYFPHHNVGVVGKRGVGRHCFLDVGAWSKRLRTRQGKPCPRAIE
jgi:Bifunctional DNA primase/polymerase, N-terminal